MQKRLKKEPCLRQSNVERYEKQFKECFAVNYNLDEEATNNINDESWGEYRVIDST